MTGLSSHAARCARTHDVLVINLAHKSRFRALANVYLARESDNGLTFAPRLLDHTRQARRTIGTTRPAQLVRGQWCRLLAMDLRGARIVITGGSRGIGEAIARDLALKGAHIALVARNVGLLEAVAGSLPNAVAVAADLSDQKAVDGLIARCEDALGGPIDVLVNNAGVDEVGFFSDVTAEDIVRIHQINLITPIELCRQASLGMRARGKGHIVNVSSMAGSVGFPGMTLYCSTKAGLSNFSGILRRELAKTGVGLTIVELGPIPTDMLANVTKCPPVAKAFTRFRRMQLLPNVSRERVAKEVVAAIETGRQCVRLPKRAALFPMARAFPQRAVNLLTRGID